MVLVLVLIAQDQVVGHGHVQDQAAGLAVLGDKADAALFALGDGQLGDVLAVQQDAAGGGADDPGHQLGDLLLSAVVDAGQAEDLSLADLEADVVEPVPVGDMVELQHDLVPDMGIVPPLQHQVAPHHQAGDLLRRGVESLYRIHHLAGAQHGDAVAEGHDLLELVGDDDDGLPQLLQALEHLPQLVDLLGRQNGGGLIQNDDVGLAVERLCDLHPLLHPQGDVPDLLPDRQGKAVPVGELLDLVVHLAAVDHGPCPGLRPQDHVLRHGQAGD